MPAWRAASSTFVPAGTSISLPSMVSLGTAAAPDESLEFLAELLDVADVWAHGAVVERADRGPGPALGDVQDRVEVLLAAFALHDPMGHLVDPSRRLAARRALSARLVGVEAGHHHERLGDRHGLVEHDDAGR